MTYCLRHNVSWSCVQSELKSRNIIAYNLLFGVKNELIFPRRVFPSRRDAAKFRCLLRNLHGLAIGEWHMYAGSSTSESGWAQIFKKRWDLDERWCWWILCRVLLIYSFGRILCSVGPWQSVMDANLSWVRKAAEFDHGWFLRRWSVERISTFWCGFISDEVSQAGVP